MSRLRFALKLGLPGLVLLLAAFIFMAQPAGAHIPAAQPPGAPRLTPTLSPTTTPCTGWALVASDNVPSLDNYLYGVSALSANDIWAVGIYFTADSYARTLVEHWNGTAWTVVPSANPGTNSNSLFGVRAIAPNDVWAVGWYSNTNIQQPLTMHWDGTTWTQVDVANPGPGREVLLAVDGVATNDVWAVGIGCNRALCDQRLPLALHWDGTAWSFVSTPAPATFDHEFNGVVALASNDVWAVGQACTQNGCAASDTLVEHWNGTAWAVVPSPNTGQALNTLYAVDARSSSDIWAVGQTCSNGNCDSVQSLTEHWNGTAWSVVSSPNPGSVDTHLNAVAIGAADDAWAGGSYTSNGTSFSNALFHWDGSAWSVVPASNPGSVDNDLRGMAALSQNNIWAVGDLDSGSGERTQVQHYTGPCSGGGTPTSTSTATATVTTHTDTPTATRTATSIGTLTPTSTRTATSVVTLTSTATGTATSVVTLTPTSTGTATSVVTLTPTGTGTPCSISFSDVQPTDYFYSAVRYLYCHGVISGYTDGTFRPYTNTTRGQLTKIVVLAEQWTIDTTGGPHFADVPEGQVFYPFVETAYNRGIISGYSDGTFKWNNYVTRAQLSKIVVLAQGWTIDTTGGPHFTDVPTTNAFYAFVETAYNHSVISGYSDGTFRPGNNATRGQIAKIVYQALGQP